MLDSLLAEIDKKNILFSLERARLFFPLCFLSLCKAKLTVSLA